MIRRTPGRCRAGTRDVDQGDQRDGEGVAQAHEPGGLLRGLDVQHTGQYERLVADDADHLAVDPGQCAHHVGGPVFVVSMNSPSSTSSVMTARMSYGLFGSAGTIWASDGRWSPVASRAGRRGGTSRLLLGSHRQQ